jgi:polyphosphate kinase
LHNPQQDSNHFARLKIPTNRWTAVPADPDQPMPGQEQFLPVEQLVLHHIGEMFPGLEVVSAHPFRITRNADVLRDEEEADDLLKMISAELRQRRFASVVQLEVAHDMPLYDRHLLMRELALQPEDVYEVDGLIRLTDCMTIAGRKRPLLKDKPWEPVVPTPLSEEGRTKNNQNIFAIMRQGDILVHHPYESFSDSVQRLIEEAAVDPDVLAIKLTLYRTSSDSPIVAALTLAAEWQTSGRVLVEVNRPLSTKPTTSNGPRIRTSRRSRSLWPGRAENPHQSHPDCAPGGRRSAYLRPYRHRQLSPQNSSPLHRFGISHLRPGNWPRPDELIPLPHRLCPGARVQKVLLAPRYMRKIFIELIHQEIEHAANQGNGRIIAKMNALDDVEMIRELYAASQAGVQIDLILRGHSRLRPGLPGFSDNIRVISLLGRFLEHDRIFYFHNNGRRAPSLAAPIGAGATSTTAWSLLHPSRSQVCKSGSSTFWKPPCAITGWPGICTPTAVIPSAAPPKANRNTTSTKR